MHLCEEQRRLLGEPVGPFEVPLRPSEAKLAEHDLLRRGPRLEGGRDGGNLKKSRPLLLYLLDPMPRGQLVP